MTEKQQKQQKQQKLTKPQQELLDAMKAGVEIHYMPYRGSFNPTAYYYRSDTRRTVTAAAKALIDLNLAKNAERKRSAFLVLTSLGAERKDGKVVPAD